MGCIFAIDLATETYRKIPLPPDTCVTSTYYWRLAAFSGCLFVYYTIIEQFAVWMIDNFDSSVDKMWIKMLSLKLDVCHIYTGPTPIAYLKSKNWLLFAYSDGNGMLAWYDVGKQSLQFFFVKVNPDDHVENDCANDLVYKYNSIYSHVIPSSLVRINRSSGTSLKRKRKRKQAGHGKFVLKVVSADHQEE